MVVGQTLGHYRIRDKLGAGGMGEVYLAEDSTLKRQVALKVLPPELAASKERLDRFQREAETLAALDHPNIVTIHSVEEVDEVRFLTMQLVEGKRLSDLIPKSGMALERIFDIAIPLADALAAAHDKGVIHRDLKPGNIMVTDEGRVKVLDFGLAKLRPDLEAGEATSLPTEPLTDEGRILGTVPYMSPEQLEGREIDARTDIFSLGVILYEMATGERPFRGDSSISIITSIIRDAPREIDTLRPELPHHLARIIRHCLEKEPRRRSQSALDVTNELEDLKTESASGEVWRTHPPPLRRRTGKLWFVLGVVGLGLVAGLVLAYRELLPLRKPAAVGMAPTTGGFSKLTFDPALEVEPSLSPDGRFFVYASDAAGNWNIYLQRIAGGRAINLTEDSPEDDRQPAFSPDGEQIAFRSEREGGGLFLMGATGESARRLTDFGYRPSWSPDGRTILFATRVMKSLDTALSGLSFESDLWALDVETGETQLVLDGRAWAPSWSPRGNRIAYSGRVDRYGQTDIWTIPPAGGEPVPVTEDAFYDWNPTWSPDGEFLYFVSDRGGPENIWRASLDEKNGAVLGEPEPVTSGVAASPLGLTLSADGRSLAYSSRIRSVEIQRVAFDPDAERVTGPPETVIPASVEALGPSVSPDGEWIAFEASFGNPESKSIGIIRKDGTDLRQLTKGPHRDRNPTWAPDGQRIAFRSNRSGSLEIWTMKADGSELRQMTLALDQGINQIVWSPDGTRLATDILYKETLVFDADSPWSEIPPSPLPPFGENDTEFFGAYSWSPDGKFLAGWSNNSAKIRLRIAIYSFETGKYQEFPGWGDWPMWLSDGRRLLFDSHEGDFGSTFSILDTETGERHEVISSEILSIAPDRILPGLTLSPDNRSIYFARSHTEADIWMLTFDQEP